MPDCCRPSQIRFHFQCKETRPACSRTETTGIGSEDGTSPKSKIRMRPKHEKVILDIFNRFTSVRFIVYFLFFRQRITPKCNGLITINYYFIDVLST